MEQQATHKVIEIHISIPQEEKRNITKGFLSASGQEWLADELRGKHQQKSHRWMEQLEFNFFIFIEILQLKDKKKMYFTV